MTTFASGLARVAGALRRGLAWLSDHTRLSCRIGNLLAVSCAMLLWTVASSLTQKTYYTTCKDEIGDLFYSEGKGLDARTVIEIILVVLIIFLPIFLAQSNILIKINLALSALTLFLASLLVSTATTIPEECFTMGGDYEDHASGLPEFFFYMIFIVLVSYLMLLVEWSTRAIRFVIAVLSGMRGRAW
jgi:hypothetical protein